MWMVFALGSAFFAGLTAILAKCGIRETDSTVATAIRTIVVLFFSWLMVFLSGAQSGLPYIDGRTWLFLILSGLATGASWPCYFKALQIGDVNKVVPVDKTSTVLTILMAFAFLGESISLPKAAGVVLIGAGTFLMIERKEEAKVENSGRGWFFYASGSAVFAALTAILGKIGIEDVDSNLGTAIRTCVVLIMAWFMVAVERKGDKVKAAPRKELGFVCLSGLATGASWLCYFRALQDGPASVVVPVDKLSIVVTAVFAWTVFHERLSIKSVSGLVAIVCGTLLMLAP